MAESQMLECEQKKLFLVNGQRELRWMVVPVAQLTGVSSKQIRCKHCHGAVRVHKQQVPNGPQDHVEHLSRQDSEHCRGGAYFQGTHRMSLQPVD